MRPLVAPGQAAPRVTQLARGRRPAGAARGKEMHSQLPTLGSRRVGLGPRPSRRAIAGTHEAPSHVANVSTGGSDSGAHAQGITGGDATVSGTTLLVSIHGKLDYGLQMGISGDDKEFGDWKPERAYILKWTEGDVWTARVDLPSTVKEVEYKLLTTYKGKEFDWEDYENRTLDLTPGGGDAICRVSGEYGKALDVQITPRPAGMPAAPAAPGPDAAYTGGAAQRQGQHAQQHLNVNNITSQPAASLTRVTIRRALRAHTGSHGGSSGREEDAGRDQFGSPRLLQGNLAVDFQRRRREHHVVQTERDGRVLAVVQRARGAREGGCARLRTRCRGQRARDGVRMECRKGLNYSARTRDDPRSGTPTTSTSLRARVRACGRS